jgi:hypothetical protein
VAGGSKRRADERGVQLLSVISFESHNLLILLRKKLFSKVLIYARRHTFHEK